MTSRLNPKDLRCDAEIGLISMLMSGSTQEIRSKMEGLFTS